MPERRRALAAFWSLLLCGAAWAPGCARSEVQVRWDDAYAAAQHELYRGEPTAAARDLAALASAAPRPIDAAAAARDEADALAAAGDDAGALAVLTRESERAARKPDRAHAHYAIARWAEAHGRVAEAIAMYRALVRTYPDLMPGERSLAHLERLFSARGRAGVDAHLAWTHAIYPVLASTSLGDNLVFFAATTAFRRWVAGEGAAYAELAERLYRDIDTSHRQSGLWNDAWWYLSWLYHRQGRVRDEIAAIRRIQRTREKVSLFGHDEHPYFFEGQLRVARLELLALDDPAAAAASYDWFVANYPVSLLLDDVLFWRGCALLRAGRPDAAEASFAEIAVVRPEGSKWLARVPAARRDPRGPVCVPEDFTRAPEDLR
ncbi:MAG: tetratricopeptide repeat protein [Deltaproteobacteria bacterium]|nr:tetratricopeptide repeat protein [Deltaproteobacteria bacterium]